jgi:predicted ATPase/DNA-binding SARP family transcriptional activator
MSVFVQLLGVAKAEHEGQSVAFVPDKRYLLLAYLAYSGDWVGREHLAFLFWPDITPPDARKNLRHLLSRVRSLEFAQLESNDEQLRWRVETDVAQFQQALGQGDWEKAIGLYKGRLLEGLEPELPDYEDWLRQEQEHLHNAFREAALNHCKALEAQGHSTEAHVLLSKVLKEDALAEDILQAYLRTAQQTQRSEALKAYEGFKTLLHRELGLEPLEATQQLAQALHQSSPTELAVQPSRPPAAPVAVQEASKLRNFPAQLTAFVGRDVELSEIAGFFKEPEIRLLTLVGPGGIGKTRMAIQVALEQHPHFADGAVFVPLSSVARPDGLTPAIAAALELSFSSAQSPQAQLKAHLQNQELLLLLDNLEHLLSGVGIIWELLQSCSKLKILTTSREVLNFQGEHRVEVAGLDVPKDAGSAYIEAYDSVQLFLRRARRVAPRFSLEAAARPTVARICQMLHGSPLAIELATNWLRVLSVQEVEAEIQKSLDFLQANQADLPQRHRSLRAVFEYSWQLLSSEEQAALKRLSVFRGGFDKEAAEAVGAVAVRTLLTLSNKSLLQRDSSGRFDLHPTVQQFSREQLTSDPQEEAQVQQRQADYYLDFLAHWGDLLEGERQLEALPKIGGELPNIRLAWEWALQQADSGRVRQVAEPLHTYFERIRGDLQAIEFTPDLAALPSQTPLQRSALAALSFEHTQRLMNLGRFDEAERISNRASELLHGLEEPLLHIRVLDTSARLAYRSGNLELSRDRLLQALQHSRSSQNPASEARALGNLAIVEGMLANYPAAEGYHLEVIAFDRERNNFAKVIHDLGNYGSFLVGQQRHAEAKAILQEALQLARQHQIYKSLDYILRELGELSEHQGNLTEGQAYFVEALEVAQPSGDTGSISGLRVGLAMNLNLQGRFAEARAQLQQALSLIWGTRELPLVMEALIGWGHYLLHTQALPQAAAVLDLVIAHKATKGSHRETAQRLRASIDLGPTAELGTLEALVDELLSAAGSVSAHP